MLIVRVKPVEPLFDALTPLTRIATQAQIQISPETFSITVSQHAPRIIASFQMTDKFFDSYLVTQKIHATICLDSFHNLLMDARIFPSITINLRQDKLGFLLRFENSKNKALWRGDLEFLTEDQEQHYDVAIRNIDFLNCVSLDSRDLGRIIQEFSVSHQDRVCVTLKGSQVKFSLGTKESILTKEEGQFRTLSQQDGVEIQFQFTFHPMSFFNALISTDNPTKIWFLKTDDDSQSIISVPYGFFGRYFIYFPQI